MAFNDIVGHKESIQRLQKYLRAGRLQGAYLFIGPEGVGKSLVATTLAKALNCLKLTDDSCDQCVSCAKIKSGQHPDVHTIDAGLTSEIKIESIRLLQEKISFKPYEGRKKIFLIHDAHTMNQEASSAFLKTLEEPPKDSILILISAKPNLLLRTIVSRCQVIKFSCLLREELADILRIQYHLEGTLTHFLSYFCEGRIGAALRLKDTDVVAQKNRIIDQFIIQPHSVSRQSNSFDRQQMRSILTIMASWFRDVYLLKAGASSQESINLDRKDELLTFAGEYTFTELDEIMQMISNSFVSIEQYVNVKLLLASIKATLTH